MEIKRKSYFKYPSQDRLWFKTWVSKLEEVNGRNYASMTIQTSIGQTHVWGLNLDKKCTESIVIFPGARTTSLFWDFDNGLDNLGPNISIYLVETNGLPNLSDGDTPDIKTLDYGYWAQEVLDKLELDNPYIAGASFGGLICMKLAIVCPQRIKGIFLLNPGCLQPFSLGLKNLYYNLLPIVKPNARNVSKFLNNAIFHKPNHSISPICEQLLIEYELFALKNYKDNTQKPYYMNEELKLVASDTCLIVGEKDILFPFEKSILNAKSQMKGLVETIILPEVGHGIETYSKALTAIRDRINMPYLQHSKRVQGSSYFFETFMLSFSGYKLGH